MKILYISQYYPPEMGAPAARVSELSSHWSAMGHRVTVLTGFPNHPTGVVHDEYRSRFRRLLYRERLNRVSVQRTWLLPLPNRRPHERILNYTSFFLSSCLVGAFMPRPDVIIATSPQLLVGLTGWWLGRVTGIPWILEVRDLWPESITSSGVGSQGSLFSRTLSAISGFLYRKCDGLVVVTPAFKKDIVEKYHIRSDKISIVENGVETELFSPGRGTREFKTKLGLEDKFMVSCIGTLGLAHGLETVLHAAASLQGPLSNLLFLFVGEGADKERLQNMAYDMGLKNVVFQPQEPREKVPDLIRGSDACLVLLKKAEVFKTVIPTKMLEFMSCGRPVILGVDGQARQIMDEASSGVFVEPENPAALATAVQRLHADENLREALGRNGRNYIVRNLSRQKTAETYIRVIEGLLSKWHPGLR